MINEIQVKKYCYEEVSEIENYDKAIADETQTWHIHHKVESIMNCGAEALKAKGAYYSRPARELIFVTPKQHRLIHNKDQSSRSSRSLAMRRKWKNNPQSWDYMKGKEYRQKLSKSLKGKKNYTPSPETRRKISESHKGKTHTEETKRLLSELAKQRKGFYWWTNGTDNVKAKVCPTGFHRGRTMHNGKEKQA